jgi:hypothetical protein
MLHLYGIVGGQIIGDFAHPTPRNDKDNLPKGTKTCGRLYGVMWANTRIGCYDYLMWGRAHLCA